MKSFLSFGLLGILCLHSFANTHYVSPTGDNSANGTENNPWKTLQHSVSQLLIGDTLSLLPGEYNEFFTLKEFAGTEENPLVITTRKGDEHKAIIDGTGVTITFEGVDEVEGGLIQIASSSNIKISNIKIQNSVKDGIIAVETANIILDNISTYNTASSGIGIWDSQDISVVNCNIENACQAQRQEFITVSGTHDFEVQNCVVTNTTAVSVKEGIDAKGGSTKGIISYNRVTGLNAPGIYIDAWDKETHEIEVYNNLVQDCNGIALASEAGGELHSINVYNNICYNNIMYGIILGNWGDVDTNIRPIHDINIVHNTIINNGLDTTWGGGISLENRNMSNIAINNNIISGNKTFQINNQSNQFSNQIDFGRNVVWGKTDDPDELSTDYYIMADPKLTGDIPYKPTAESPGIDKAEGFEILIFDYNYKQRPIDGDNDGSAISDIGAIEYDYEAGSSIDLSRSNSSIKNKLLVYPNPFLNELTVKLNFEEVRVFNSLGKQIYSGTGNQINTSNWSPGLYVIQVRTQKNTIVLQKCIKQ